jgi:EAL domain-containing protein (putative c-di-GMP-specific phosphodiesterase class I)
VRVALDDFGTGYSSLAYLRQFPLDSVKIDRLFVQGLVDKPEDAAIIRAMIGLAHNLQLTLTAEGVETPGQLRFLREAGCDHAQGFLFSVPLPADEVPARIRDRYEIPDGGS